MARVRGSQETRPEGREFGKDTVYIRRNIVRVEEPAKDGREGFSGWEYDEEQYTYQEWCKKDCAEKEDALAELAEIITGGGA